MSGETRRNGVAGAKQGLNISFSISYFIFPIVLYNRGLWQRNGTCRPFDFKLYIVNCRLGGHFLE